jgi:hypothetical protein
VVGSCYRKAITQAAGGEVTLGRELRTRAKGRGLDALRQGLSGGKLPDVLGDYRPALEMLIGKEERA